MRRFTPEERKFIELTARGDAIERAARTLGKIAPVQTIPMLGEFALIGGAALSGSPGALAAAVALPVIGGLSKALSTAKTTRFSRKASEATRRGPQ
jgi:Asp/Glu/hydantoin racemase